MVDVEHSDPWLPPPVILYLPEQEAHVWRAGLDLPAGEIERLRSVLSKAESDRAARFRFPEDRRHYVAAHGILRHVLSRYCGRAPEELEFEYGVAGKPALRRRSVLGDVRFNLSHSHAVALYAVSLAREAGVDVEIVKPRLAGERIAERFFSPNEASALRSLPQALQAEAFFQCWTRKEAYIKARGGGLSIPLDSFSVSFAPGERARLLSVEGDPEEPGRWFMKALSPGPGYAAALVVEGRECQVRLWDWSKSAST